MPWTDDPPLPTPARRGRWIAVRTLYGPAFGVGTPEAAAEIRLTAAADAAGSGVPAARPVARLRGSAYGVGDPGGFVGNRTEGNASGVGTAAAIAVRHVGAPAAGSGTPAAAARGRIVGAGTGTGTAAVTARARLAAAADGAGAGDAATEVVITNPVLVSANAAAASSMALPAHQAGDLLVMYAFRNGSASQSTLPAGWTSHITDNRNLVSQRVAYKIAASAAEVSGTWTNADTTVCLVYRNASGLGAAATGVANTSTITIPALALNVADGSSVVAVFAGRDGGGLFDSSYAPPAGTTLRAFVNTRPAAAGYDTGVGVTGYAGSTITTGSSAEWNGMSVEVLAA